MPYMVSTLIRKSGLTDISFSSGAWGNQFDMELFYILNPELDSMVLDLPVGEPQQVTIPLIISESQFTEAQWRAIDSREFYIDLQFYPEHIRFLCPTVLYIGMNGKWHQAFGLMPFFVSVIVQKLLGHYSNVGCTNLAAVLRIGLGLKSNLLTLFQGLEALSIDS